MKLVSIHSLLLLGIVFFLSCREHGERSIFDQPMTVNPLPQENIGRSSWQKPGEVIALLGDISEKSVVDVGAGTGYFSFRLAFNAAKVLALEIDPGMIDIIESFKANLPLEIQNKIESRYVEPDDPELEPEEVDIAVIINTIAYIDNREDYLKKILAGLKENCRIMIIDFKTSNLPFEVGSVPKVSASDITNDLASAGFQNIVVNNYTLDYQYIIFADCKNKLFEKEQDTSAKI